MPVCSGAEHRAGTWLRSNAAARSPKYPQFTGNYWQEALARFVQTSDNKRLSRLAWVPIRQPALLNRLLYFFV